jgi:hypothetical protein
MFLTRAMLILNFGGKSNTSMSLKWLRTTDYTNDVGDTQYDVNHDDDDLNVETLLAHVTKRRQPIQTQRQRINQSSATNSGRNHLPQEAWDHIPSDVQKMLRFNNNPNSGHVLCQHRTVNFSDQFPTEEAFFDIDHLNHEAANVTEPNDNEDSMLAFLASHKSHSNDDAHKVLAANNGTPTTKTNQH